VEWGESDIDAVRREVLEETGLTVEPGELVGSVRRPAPDGGVFEIHDYRCAVAPGSGDLRAGDDASEVRWVSAAEYPTLPLVPRLTQALTEWSVLPR
jgi:8-oxo-dGTP diphosphatase